MIYLVSIIAVLLVIFLAGMLYIYRMAFASRRNIHPADEEMPSQSEQYSPYAERLIENVRKLAKVPFEPVEITSHDGLRLFGRFYDAGTDAPVAILFHGYRSTALRDASGGAPFCMRNGFSVLIVDQRSHGRSEGRAITFGIKERIDCLKWIEYVIARQGSNVRIMLMGVSMGAATVLMAADLGLPKNVRAIAADCPYSSPEDIICCVADSMGIPSVPVKPILRLTARLFAGIDLNSSCAVSAVKGFDRPVFLIHGDDDRFVPCEMSRRIAASNPDICMLTEVPGAGHGIAYYVDTAMYEDAAAKACKATKSNE